MESKRYIVVGGNPFTGYTNTTSFTAIKVIGSTDSLDEAKGLFKLHYEECGGLLKVIDTQDIYKEVEL